MTALVKAISKEPVQAAATTVVLSLASWTGRLVSLPGFSNGNLLTGALFGILANRFANINEVVLKQFSFFVVTPTRKDGSKKGDPKEPVLNKYGFVTSYLIGGAAAAGICIGLGLMTIINLIQAVALTALAITLSKFVPADRLATAVIKGITEKKPPESKPADKPADNPEDTQEGQSV